MDGHTSRQTHTLAPFPQLWARWTVAAAAFAAARDPRGPRILPLLAWFRNGPRSGSVLHALPGGRAALWGEVPIGSPAHGTVRTFGYRWEAGHWYVAEPPLPFAEYRPALPGIWSTDETADLVVALVDDEQRRAAAVEIVCATELGTVTRSLIAETFGDHERFDIAAATRQLAMAGALAPTGIGRPCDFPGTPAPPAHYSVADQIPLMNSASFARLPVAPPALSCSPAALRPARRPENMQSASERPLT